MLGVRSDLVALAPFADGVFLLPDCSADLLGGGVVRELRPLILTRWVEVCLQLGVEVGDLIVEVGVPVEVLEVMVLAVQPGCPHAVAVLLHSMRDGDAKVGAGVAG